MHPHTHFTLTRTAPSRVLCTLFTIVKITKRHWSPGPNPNPNLTRQALLGTAQVQGWLPLAPGILTLALTLALTLTLN